MSVRTMSQSRTRHGCMRYLKLRNYKNYITSSILANILSFIKSKQFEWFIDTKSILVANK